MTGAIHFRRARGWYLYDDRGRRYCDFHQADGAAILGHRPEGLSTRVKNEISRGLWAAVPTPWTARAVRAVLSVVADLTPRRAVFVAPSTAANASGNRIDSRIRISRWRPFAGEDGSYLEGADIVVPVVPWPLPGLPVPFVALTAVGASFLDTLDDEKSISPVHGAGIVHVCAALRAALDDGGREVIDGGENLETPPGYRRRGVYFVPHIGEEHFLGFHQDNVPVTDSWISLRRRAIDGGILLPPSQVDTIVIPGEIGRREGETWRRLWGES